MGRFLSNIIGWFFRLLGVTFNIKELVIILSNSGGGAVIDGIATAVGKLPLWLVIVSAIATFIILTFAIGYIWAFIKKDNHENLALQIYRSYYTG